MSHVGAAAPAVLVASYAALAVFSYDAVAGDVDGRRPWNMIQYSSGCRQEL